MALSFDARAYSPGGEPTMDRKTEQLRDSYDRLARPYADNLFDELSHKPLDRALLDVFAEEMRGKGPVVDVGCGPGQVARYLRERGVSVSGLDLSPGMVALAARLTPEVAFREGSILALPEADGAWAGCTAFYAIVHFDPAELRRAARELARVLRPSGLLLLGFHEGTERVHRDELFGVAVDLDFVFWKTASVERELVEAGFVIEARLERAPYVGHEHPSHRAYLFARRQA
jgi:SAM-dependent methyltransferase